jgi:hypothetical protein
LNLPMNFEVFTLKERPDLAQGYLRLPSGRRSFPN